MSAKKKVQDVNCQGGDAALFQYWVQYCVSTGAISIVACCYDDMLLCWYVGTLLLVCWYSDGSTAAVLMHY